MKRIFLFLLTIYISLNLFSKDNYLDKSEIYLELFRISVEVQQSEINDFIEYNDLNKEDTEALTLESLYLDLIDPSEDNILRSVESLNYNSFNSTYKQYIADFKKILNGTVVSAKNQYSHKLNNYYESISNKSPNRNFNYDTQMETALNTDNVIKSLLAYKNRSEFDKLERLLSWVEGKELETDFIPIRVEESSIDFYIYDPLLYKIMADSYLFLSKKNVEEQDSDIFGAIKTYYKLGEYDRVNTFYKKADKKDTRVEAYKILSDIDSGNANISSLLQKDSSKTKFVSYLLTEYLVHNYTTNDSIKKIFETHFLEEPPSEVNSTFNYLNNLTSSVYFLRDAIYYKSYHAFVPMKDFFLKDKNELRRSKWILLYINCRFENGRDDRNAGKEIATLFNKISETDIYMAMLRKIFAQYYIHHINAKF